MISFGKAIKGSSSKTSDYYMKEEITKMTLRSITNVFRRLSLFRQRRALSSTPKERPYQICDHCAPTLFEYYGYDVADIGTCDNCYQKSDCIDVALIEHYRAQEIDEDSISCTLPRLRQYLNAQPMSWKDIDELIEKRFKAKFNTSL